MDTTRLRTMTLGFLVAAVVLGCLGWLVGVDDVVTQLREADPGGVVLVVGLIAGWVAAWGLGIRAVLAALDTPTSPWTGVLVSAGAGFANNVTPFGHAGGEPLTGLLLVERTGASYERGLAAMATADTVNAVPAVGFGLGGVCLIAVDQTVGSQVTVAAVGGVGMVVAVAMIGVVSWRRRTDLATRVTICLETVFGPIARLVPQLTPPTRRAIATRVDGFVDDVERVAGSRRTLLIVVAYSALGWLSQIAACWAAFTAVGAPIPFAVALAAVPISSVAAILPLPGGAGGVESVLVGLLVATPLASLPSSTAVAGVIVFRGIAFWLPTAAGGVVFAQSAIRRRRGQKR